MYNINQLELRLKLCLRGIKYDLGLNTPISIERAKNGEERAEQYKKEIASLEQFEREYYNKFIEESEVKI